MINLITNYIENLSIEELDMKAKEYNIYLSNDELLFSFNYIKENYVNIINNPSSFDLSEHKKKFSEENFNKILVLINKYKY